MAFCFLNYVNHFFLPTVNKCTIIMIIIISNVKYFLERHFCGISIYSFENNLTKKAVLHPDANSARQVLRVLSSTNQGNSSETTFVAGATKINLTTLKIWLWLDDLMQETILRHQLFRDGRVEPLKDSARSLTWAYDLKALKSSS